MSNAASSILSKATPSAARDLPSTPSAENLELGGVLIKSLLRLSPRFCGRDVMEYQPDSGSGSFRLDVEGPDDVAPLLSFVGDELAKVGGREHEHVATQVGKPRLDLRIGEASVDLSVELVDDLGRRGLRCAGAVPTARLVTWHELSHGRDVGQRVRAYRGDRRRGARVRRRSSDLSAVPARRDRPAP